MVKTVRAKWSEITGNRKEIDETIIGKGIEEQSLVNSDELNSIVYRQDEMLDDLQRANAWNIGKEYNQGDMIFVNVNYKRLSDAMGKTYKCFVICKQDKVTAEPFINKDRKAIAFSKNYDYAVTQFIIQVDNDSTALTHFINSDFWEFVNINDDLSNATKLSVSNEAKLGSQGKDSSIITFDRDIILNGNLDTKGTFDIKGNLIGGSLHSNNNIAWGEAFARTPAFTARGDEIVNAEWCNSKEIVFIDALALVLPNAYHSYQITHINSFAVNPPYYKGIELAEGLGDIKQPPIKEKLYSSYNNNQFIFRAYKTFPQDFNIESFNSFFLTYKTQIVREDFVNYESWGGININSIMKCLLIHSAFPVYINGIYNYDNLKTFLSIPTKIQVDFSKSFEFTTYEYFKSLNIDNIILQQYVDTTPFAYWFVNEKNYNVISWNKDTRTLSVAFVQDIFNHLGYLFWLCLCLSKN